MVTTALVVVALWGMASPASAQQPIVAQFWYAFGGKNREVTEAHIKKFNESQSKYRIEGAFQGDYFQAIAKIRAASITKTAPPIFHVVGEFLPNLWQAGLLENMESYAKGPNGTDLADFLPAQTQNGYFDYLGKPAPPLFALPFFRSTPILYYNAEMLAAKGVKVPTTWDELRAGAGKLTVREGTDVKTYGFEVPVDWWFWFALLHQAGGTLMTPDGKRAAFRDKGGEALQFWVDMVQKDKTMKQPPGKDYSAWEVANTDFLNSRVAMIFTSTAFLNYITENAKFKVGTAFLPAKAKSAVPAGGTFFVMLKDAPAPQKEAGWAFIKWMTDPAQTISLSKATGYMPIRLSAINGPEMQAFYKENPNYKVALDQLKFAQKFPFSPALFEVYREAVQPNLEAPVVGTKSVAEAMAAAETKANEIIGKYKD
ncbi:MAG: ABC transporter substrate-binding protein [Candidatus Rokuibacteriota bacterium]